MTVCLTMTKQKSDIMLFSFTLVQTWKKFSYSLIISEFGSRNILQFCIFVIYENNSSYVKVNNFVPSCQKQSPPSTILRHE